MRWGNRASADRRPRSPGRTPGRQGATGGPRKTSGPSETALGNEGPLRRRAQALALPLLLSGPAAPEDRAGQGSQDSPGLPRCCLPGVDGVGGSEQSAASLPVGLRAGGEGKARATHPGLLRSGALPLCEALGGGDRGALSGEATGSPPYTKAAPSPASYPGTVVKTWHAGDALVSLLAFLQEGRWAGLLPLDTVPTDALGGKGEGRGQGAGV